MKTHNLRRFGFAFALALATGTLASSVALAETVDSAGYVSELEVNEPTADKYLQYHGRVVLTTWGKNAMSTEYRWGGTACGTRMLGADKVSLLQRAMEGGMKVTPRYQIGQGASKCLVGFVISSN
jgi:hypothetical protein